MVIWKTDKYVSFNLSILNTAKVNFKQNIIFYVNCHNLNTVNQFFFARDLFSRYSRERKNREIKSPRKCWLKMQKYIDKMLMKARQNKNLFIQLYQNAHVEILTIIHCVITPIMDEVTIVVYC